MDKAVGQSQAVVQPFNTRQNILLDKIINKDRFLLRSIFNQLALFKSLKLAHGSAERAHQIVTFDILEPDKVYKSLWSGLIPFSFQAVLLM